MEVNFRFIFIFLMLKKSKSFCYFYVYNSDFSFKNIGGLGKLVKRLDIYFFKINLGNMKYIL